MMILLCLYGGTNFGQTRINQISQQLTLGVLELEDDEDSFAASESCGKTSDQQISHEVAVFFDCTPFILYLSYLHLSDMYDRRLNFWISKGVKLLVWTIVIPDISMQFSVVVFSEL